jgi:hypothetical protein
MELKDGIIKVLKASKRIFELEAENAALKTKVKKLTAHNKSSLTCPCDYWHILQNDWRLRVHKDCPVHKHLLKA